MWAIMVELGGKLGSGAIQACWARGDQIETSRALYALRGLRFGRQRAVGGCQEHLSSVIARTSGSVDGSCDRVVPTGASPKAQQAA